MGDDNSEKTFNNLFSSYKRLIDACLLKSITVITDDMDKYWINDTIKIII